MRRADLNTANGIVNRLGEINKERCALVLNLKSAGVRVDDSAQTWVDAKTPETREAIKRLLVAELDREEAALRRRAAQISLAL